jgi:hypothetical protein
MPDSQAKTKAGKQRFVSKAMGEFKSGEMKSASGQTVSDPKQAIAIALNQTGQSKPKRNGNGGPKRNGNSGKGGSSNANSRIAGRLTDRLAAHDR